tara:strand:- start:651 stop:1007 length:357 start_codon:yes stop_codon:yes gene_type:complete
MAQLKTKVKKYLEANSKTWEAERNNILLQNDSDGNGDYIKSWNVSGLAKPNDSQIASYETAGNTAETLAGVLNTRKNAYKDFGYQLDLLYHDMLADKGNKTGEWFKHIKAVKDANSKE